VVTLQLSAQLTGHPVSRTGKRQQRLGRVTVHRAPILRVRLERPWLHGARALTTPAQHHDR
jgi:hypothetical protein